MSMHKIIWCGSLLLLLLGLTNCGYQAWVFRKPKHHNAFVDVRASRPVIDPATRTVRMYVDAFGHLYPNAALPSNSDLKNKYNSSLVQYFYDYRNKAALTALATYYGVGLTPAPDTRIIDHGEAQWVNLLQGVLAAKVADDIKTVTEDRPGQPPRPLVVLIHGYNVSEEELTTGLKPGDKPYYEAVREELAGRPELRDAAWLEVCWDGLREKLPVFIWGAGQLNARYAGLALREVLRRTNPAIPLRIFTHSSGAIAATHLLWNNTSPYAGDTRTLNTELTRRLTTTPTLQHCDVRAGMIVPATPPNAFYNFAERTPGTGSGAAPCAGEAAPLPHYRIIIGQNRKDYAVTKVFFPAVIVGSTTMGCKKRAFRLANNSVKSKAPGQQLQLVQLSQTGFLKPAPRRLWAVSFLPFWESHDWPLYFRRTRSTEFVDKVLVDAP